VSQHDQTTEQWVRLFCEAKGLLEGSHHGQTDYRLAGKIVVNLESNDSITIKLPIDEQQALLHEHPEAVRLPPGWGHHGWTTLQFISLSSELVGQLIEQAIETIGSPKPRKR
jgi:hypothetical protein